MRIYCRMRILIFKKYWAMRKYIYSFIMVFATMLYCVGCSRIEEKLDHSVMEGENILEGTFEGNAKTKTILSGLENGVYKALWSFEDQISVFIDGANKGISYKLVSGMATPNAQFKGYGTGESYVALYPADMAIELSGDNLSIELPAEQVYESNSFGKGSYPMLAVSNTNSLEFKNTCAILGISMTGNHNIKSIEFTTNDEKVHVSGAAKIDISQVSAPTVVMDENASNSVILQCNGVGLNSQNAKDFYIVLPAQTYKGGFTITINTSTGKMVKTISEDVELKRSKIRKLKTFACILDEGVEPSTNLDGNGTESSPFLIQSLEDLLLMQGTVNSVDGTIVPKNSSEEVEAKSAHYKLTTDISLSAVCGAGGENWIPIGNYSANEDLYFSGVFDGDGHSITDLYINSESPYQGLFGYSRGVIENLNVVGNVKGNGRCAIICGHGYPARIANCSSSGTVESDDAYVGGIVGYTYRQGEIINCINNADILAKEGYAGGIAGYSNGDVVSCINKGTVIGKDNRIGGCVGHHFNGMLYNCSNFGKVDGTSCVGGLVGYSYHSTILNSFNNAEISGSGGEIGGVLGRNYYKDTKISMSRNCVNTGKVTSTSNKKSVGAICGFNVSEIKYCYWLYDSNIDKGIEVGIGESDDNGKTENCFSLTAEQMKGKENFGGTLYKAADDASYSNILDALNGWAFDNKSDEMLLYGWMKGDGDGYPVFTGKVAEKPSGSSTPIFELLENEFNVGDKGGEITVELKANMSYYISSIPEWITEITPEGTNGDGDMKKHIFKVQENPDFEDRQGVIVFCNESQQCIPVTVIQKAKIDQDLSWMDKEFWHKSLVMRFTADWCGYCPMMATAIADAQAQWPNKLEALSLHGSGGLQSNASVQIESMYSVTGYPTGVVDGRIKVPNYTNISYTTSQIIAAAKDTEENYETLTGASWNSSISGNRAELNLTAYIKRAGSYKVTALLVEDNIVGYQSGEGNNYNHKDVVRAAFSNATGDAFTVSTDGQVQEFSYTLDLSNAWNRDNLKVVVYIQRKDANGAYFIDNSTSAKLGKEMPLMVISDGVTGGMEGVEPGDDIPYNN